MFITVVTNMRIERHTHAYRPMRDDIQASIQRQKKTGGNARTTVLAMPPAHIMRFHHVGYFFFVVVFFVVVVFFLVEVVVFFVVEVVFFVDVAVVTG